MSPNIEFIHGEREEIYKEKGIKKKQDLNNEGKKGSNGHRQMLEKLQDRLLPCVKTQGKTKFQLGIQILEKILKISMLYSYIRIFFFLFMYSLLNNLGNNTIKPKLYLIVL